MNLNQGLRLFKTLKNVSSTWKGSRRFMNTDIGVVGIPFSRGQPKQGPLQAPARLRDEGMFKRLELLGYDVTDYGDMLFEELPDDPPSYNIKHPRTTGHAMQQISNKVEQVTRSGKSCLNIGGDHGIAIGTLHGHCQAQEDLVVVWVDAHSDINPPLASPSGNIHGMVNSFLLHELTDYMPKVPGFEWLKPCLRAKDIAFIGLRDIDPAERYIIEKFGITAYTMHDIDRHGIDYVVENVLNKLNPGLKRPIHLSFDVDSLDPTYSPSTGTPVAGGLTMREGMFIAEELSLTGKLSGIDVVEVNPELGSTADQQQTLFTACEVIAACFGKRRTGLTVPSGYELPKPSAY